MSSTTKTLKELLADRATLDVRLAAARKEAYAEALKNVRQQVEEFGFTASEVFSWNAPSKKSVPAKYLDEKTGQTWSGRGKQPKWLAGKNKEDFLVPPVQVSHGPFLAEMAAAAAKLKG